MLRFTIRDVLWLMVVVGLALGWWLDGTRLYRAYLGERAHHWQTKTNFQNYNKGAVMVNPVTLTVFVWTGYGIGTGYWEEYNGPVLEIDALSARLAEEAKTADGQSN